MNVCILGDGLTSLTLAKVLVKRGIFVDILFEDKVNNYFKSRTFGITKKTSNFILMKFQILKKFLGN